ncbi:MAG: ABC transporter permease [Candidatus Bathyarchaeia archaeon]|jgi:tungstate transport system permease protein
MADIFVQAFEQAIQLILSGDPEVYETVYRSIYVTGLGTVLACTWGIPIAIFLGLYSFRGKWAIKGLFNGLIGIPTVALGLLLYLLMSNSGIFGSFKLLYTLNGIAIGQAILLTPIIVTFTANALSSADTQLRDLARTLGASPLQVNLTLIRETVWSIILSITAAFNRGFGELGIALLIGGGFVRETSVLTTGIALQINFGNFDVAMAYAIILMVIVIAIALTVNLIERLRSGEWTWKTHISMAGLRGKQA